MFVRQSKYDAAMHALVQAVAEREAAIKAHNKLLKEWNDLVQRINDKGGTDFMESSLQTNKAIPFSQEDLSRLLQLYHPDRHGNSPKANEMTAKLLTMRATLKAMERT